MRVILSKRLKAIASLVEGESIADIGCDHGKLGAYLYANNKIKKVINMDISASSLEKADELMKSYKGCETICRVSDGCDELDREEVSCVCLAGLGGTEIAKILERAFGEGKKYERFVLSPNRHQEKVRKTLADNGYGIVNDIWIKEGHHFYTAFSAEKGAKIPSDNEIYYGINYRVDPIFKIFCEERIAHLNELLKTNKDAKGVKEELQRLTQTQKELQ